MTDIKQNAKALMDEVRKEHPSVSEYCLAVFAAQRAIEQREAFRQEVSDAVSKAIRFCKDGRPASAAGAIGAFVIPKPKPDPLLAALLELELSSDLQEGQHDAKWIRNKLDELGFEIREKNDDD